MSSNSGREDEGGRGSKEESESAGADRDWSRFSRRLEGVVPDIMKKAAASGLKSFLQTEEGVRSLLGALLPREVFNAVSEQLERSKSEAVRLISKEFREFLERVDISREIQRALTSLSIEVKTEIRFIPNDRAVVKPSIRSRAKVKSSPGAAAHADGGVDGDEPE